MCPSVRVADQGYDSAASAPSSPHSDNVSRFCIFDSDFCIFCKSPVWCGEVGWWSVVSRIEGGLVCLVEPGATDTQTLRESQVRTADTCPAPRWHPEPLFGDKISIKVFQQAGLCSYEFQHLPSKFSTICQSKAPGVVGGVWFQHFDAGNQRPCTAMVTLYIFDI